MTPLEDVKESLKSIEDYLKSAPEPADAGLQMKKMTAYNAAMHLESLFDAIPKDISGSCNKEIPTAYDTLVSMCY